MHKNESQYEWPQSIAVATMPGSLPMGGFVDHTPVHAFLQSPKQLAWSAQTTQGAQRTDIDLGGLTAFFIAPILSAAEADLLIAAGEYLGFRAEAPGIVTPPGMRQNTSVHWLADAQLLGPIFARVAHLLPENIDGEPLYPMFSHRLNMYRYRAGDVFNMHVDGAWPGYGLSANRDAMLEWPKLRSKMSMLLYLNDESEGVEGGCTRLYRADGSYVDVSPQKGCALFFRHGMGVESVLHEGRQVSGHIPKYVVRINVMYGTI